MDAAGREFSRHNVHQRTDEVPGGLDDYSPEGLTTQAAASMLLPPGLGIASSPGSSPDPYIFDVDVEEDVRDLDEARARLRSSTKALRVLRGACV